MTAYSAKEDEHALWFDTPLPGRLSDVFGLKTNAFYDWGPLSFDLEGKAVESSAKRYEVPSTAKVLGRFTNVPQHVPALTIIRFGKRNAMYLATESNASALSPVLEYASTLAGVKPGPVTPEGVYARVVEGRTLYVNTTGDEKKIPLPGTKKGLLTGHVYEGAVTLGPQEVDLVQ
jgi:beta-galactosidase